MDRYTLDARTATTHFPGIGRYVRNLAAAMSPLLQEAEHLQVLWNPSDPSSWDPSALEKDRVKSTAAPVSPFSLRQQWRIPRLLNASRTDVYHSSYYLMPYVPGAPTVLTVHDLISLLHPQTVSGRARLLFRFTSWLALRAASHVIAVSEATKEDLLRTFSIPPEQVSVVYEAADPRFRPQSPETVAELRARHDLPEQYILYLGINKPHKNLVRLIDAYARLQRPDPPALVIAGAWDDRYPEPTRRVEKLGLPERVRFLGRVDDEDLPALYTGCTLFVFPSLYEGFGLPVLEAMACGAAVACGNRSSLPEVVGDAALLFDPENVDGMAETLRRALMDESLLWELSRKGVARARQFSWRRAAEQTLSVYRHAAD